MTLLYNLPQQKFVPTQGEEIVIPEGPFRGRRYRFAPKTSSGACS
jgi:hypothetical protein